VVRWKLEDARNRRRCRRCHAHRWLWRRGHAPGRQTELTSDLRGRYFAWNWTIPVVVLATVVATTRVARSACRITRHSTYFQAPCGHKKLRVWICIHMYISVYLCLVRAENFNRTSRPKPASPVQNRTPGNRSNNCNVVVKFVQECKFLLTHFTSILQKQFAGNDTFLR